MNPPAPAGKQSPVAPDILQALVRTIELKDLSTAAQIYAEALALDSTNIPALAGRSTAV